ncbi:LysR family transcriptional regulator [Aliiroseovarius lamellibrachiae]|uniref:LysR family transcriptional regulator n=1 Tax=Aliiroseovarius lamellibrachiae TaxID=1924933 RepID=UPI001BE0536F|nr:LysR family transcriptional regulator [Aliiroseovarius lamellibrachiae]MBT2130583.1 LysR family transcriptional regulator [Aliiroseovarius lamellibrachiae]
MALKIGMLRGFATVARNGNLSDAAASLGRTPSAVSMMLKQLETHLGEPLFETDRKNKLTALGAFVLEQAEREIQQFDNTVKAIEGFANATHGHVRIATVPSVAGTVIPQVFSRYINEFDNVDIEIRDMDSSSILHELSRDRIDIGIATLGENSVGFHSQLLLSDTFGVVCSPAHPLAQTKGPIQWAALEGHRLIANSLSAGIKAPASQNLHAKALLSAHNLTSLLAMVRADIGVTILPKMAAWATTPPDLVFKPLADEQIRRQVHLLRKADSALSPAARLLEKHILETAASMMKRDAA